MSAAIQALGVLSTAVHVLDPVERIPLVLHAGDEVTDAAVAEQITNPRCWEGSQVPSQETVPSRTARKTKPAQI
ncbi:hypothetical protein [Streptomyces sp. NPDC055400]